MAKERAEEIDRDNLNLLKKMQQIMKTEGARGGVDHKNTYRHHRCPTMIAMLHTCINYINTRLCKTVN